MTDLTGLFGKGIQTDVIMLDFKKSFDSVPHTKLLIKLHCYGLDRQLLGWVERWLEGRTFRVRFMDDLSSEEQHIQSGVSQGSVLGPLLFLIYVNDLPTCIS